MADHTRQRCATAITGTVHMFMRTMGPEVGKRVGHVLHPQQFRTLIILRDHGGASLSFLAEQSGITVSAASKLVDGLVDKGFVARETAADDRRRLRLTLTQEGLQMIGSVEDAETALLQERLRGLTDAECSVLLLSMELLRKALAAGPAPED